MWQRGVPRHSSRVASVSINILVNNFSISSGLITFARLKAGFSAAPALLPVRKVRTGKGTLLRKAQMGVILCSRNRKQLPAPESTGAGEGENAR